MSATPTLRANELRPARKRAPKPPPASEAVRTEWRRRVEVEYCSAAVTHHVVHWLIQIGASPDLIRMGLRIVSDELTHADLSHRAFVAAGGDGAPALDREMLQLQRRGDEPLEIDVARACVDFYCLGETVAVPLFKELRAVCTVPAARRVLDRVLVDEVRHRDFGWTLLPWLLESPLAALVRETVTRELPLFFARVRGGYAPEVSRALVEISDADKAWGLIAPATYHAVLERALERDWVPRFGRLGFDARAAWNAAPDRT
jgi:hypothetical protein